MPGYAPELSDTYLDKLQADPRDYLAAAAMGRMYLSLNEPQAARQYFEQAVWARPTDGVAWLGIAATALLRGGDERDAVNHGGTGAADGLPLCRAERLADGTGRTVRQWRRPHDAAHGPERQGAAPGSAGWDYQKRWDKALADGALLAARLKAMPPLRDQVGGVQRETMTTVDLRRAGRKARNG